MKRILLIIIVIIIALSLLSCSTSQVTQEPKNRAPIADAGEDIICYKGEEITVSAGSCTDPDGDELQYTWTIDGKKYTSKEVNLTFKNSGTFTAYLEVSDGKTTSTDYLVITIEPEIVAEAEKKVEESTEEDSAETWQAKCTRVIDGDTIELENGERVRYIGINCPESGDEYGDTATEVNSDLVLGKIVTLEKDVSETDRYGRILAYVYVGDIFINAYLVENGYAQVATYPPDVKYVDYFVELQEKAVEEGNGFWAEPEEEAEPVEEVTQEEETTQEQAPQEEEPPQEEQQVTYGINIVSLTSPIARGSQASITINTAPNVRCTITVYYKSGASKAQGLDPKNSDGNGSCTWSWKVGTRTTPGDWKIVLTAEGAGQIETYFTVTE